MHQPNPRVVLIEDFQLIAEMISISCRSLLPGAEVFQAANAATGLDLCRQQRPEWVFLDLVLPDRDGLALVPEIFACAPNARIIALTAHTDDVTLHRALAARVHGFIDKNEAPLDELRRAIEAIEQGRVHLSPAARRLRESLQADPVAFNKILSPHEQHLLGLFGDGLTNEEVGARVGLSAATVKVHRRNIMAKLDIHSTPQLIHYALEKGFTRLKRDTASPRKAHS